MNNSSKNRTFLLSLLIIIASQVFFKEGTTGHEFSMGIILFPVYGIIFKNYNIMAVTACSSLGIYILNIIQFFLATEVENGVRLWPKAAFYFIYGTLYFLIAEKSDFDFSKQFPYLALFAADWFACNCRLFFLSYEAYFLKAQSFIIAASSVRLIMTGALKSLLEYQSVRLLKAEHSERYKKLLLIISDLKGELVWMDKNSSNVEEATATGYKLYEKLLAENSPLARDALSVAKDVHEIKKGYRLINDGIAEATGNFKDKPMSFKEILTLLIENTDQYAALKGKKIIWETEVDRNFYTDKQYQLLSILRNLFENSVEAVKDEDFRLSFALNHSGDKIIIAVTNTKSQIPKENLNTVFSAGFTTKIDYTTGQIKRGIGLCIVKDMVEKELEGSVSVVSESSTTSFIIVLPKEKIERQEAVR